MTRIYKFYGLGVLLVVTISILCFLLFDLSGRVALFLGFGLFLPLNAWFIFALRKGKGGDGVVDWKKEATIIVGSLLAIGFVLLKRCG